MFNDILEDNNIVEHSDIIIRDDGNDGSDVEMFNNLNNSEMKN